MRRIFASAGPFVGALLLFTASFGADPLFSETNAPGPTCSGGYCEPLAADIVVVGASSGGTAAAIAAARRGLSVILTEETGVIGGQYTAQGLTALDQGVLGTPIVEALVYTGLYDDLKKYARDHYRNGQDLYRKPEPVDPANPGDCYVSEFCFEPTVAQAFFAERLRELPNLVVLTEFRPIAVLKKKNRVIGVELEQRHNGDIVRIHAAVTVDGTDLGDVVHLSGAQYGLGPDLQSETGEILGLSAAERDGLRMAPIRQIVPYARAGEQPIRSGVMVQPFTVQFAMSKGMDGGMGVPDPPDLSSVLPPDNLDAHLSDQFGDRRPLHDPDAAFNVMTYRRLLHAQAPKEPGTDLRAGTHARSVTQGNTSLSVINFQNQYVWAMAHDYIGDPRDPTIPYAAREAVFDKAKVYSRWYLSYLQKKFRNYVLNQNAFPGSDDGFAVYPYIREGRRLRALDTVRADDIALWCKYVTHGDVELPCRYGLQECVPSSANDSCAATNGPFGVEFLRTRHSPRAWNDTIAISSYEVDVHRIMPESPFARWQSVYLGGVPEPLRSLKESALKGIPFGLPYGASVPESIDGLLATAKNMGSTHVSNGAVRLHPSETNHGESIGIAAALSVELGVTPRAIHEDPALLNRLIGEILKSGRSLTWFDDLGSYGDEEYFEEIQYSGARGYMAGFRTDNAEMPHFRPNALIDRQSIARVIVEWMNWSIEIGPGAPHFADVPPNNPFYGYVETLLSKGVTSGCGRGNYCPDSLVTRAAGTVFLSRAKRVSRVSPATPTFRHVPTSHWAYSHIEAAHALGWYLGLKPAGSDAFQPGAFLERREIAKLLFNIDFANAPVSRAQVAPVLVEIAGWMLEEPTAARYIDVPVRGSRDPNQRRNAIYVRAIETLAAHGITLECDVDRYCPESDLTREQLAVLVARTNGLPQAFPLTPTFDDVSTEGANYGHIEAVQARGWFDGVYSGRDFQPEAAATRSEVAAILANAGGDCMHWRYGCLGPRHY